MKIPKTFLVAFVAAGLLMFVQAWSARVLEIAAILAAIGLFWSGFAALAIQVGADFTGRRKLKIAGLIGVGLLLLIVPLGWSLGILPYIWNGIAVLLLCLSVLVLGGCLAWQCGHDYFQMFLRRRPPVAPADWHTLEAGELPATNSAAAGEAKKRFTHSYGVHIRCTPRTSPMGLISNPLKMDE